LTKKYGNLIDIVVVTVVLWLRVCACYIFFFTLFTLLFISNSIIISHIQQDILNTMSTESSLHNRRQPSQAYADAYLKAAKSAGYESKFDVDRDESMPWKKIIISVFMILTGISLFITGAVFYWSSDGTENNAQGKDILLLSLILLLPGLYSGYILYGAWMKWKGFRYDQLPSLEFE
jgi:hypothetical protein